MQIELGDVIKSPDVEDPVNLHVHRPLQLALVRPLLRTSITANQMTALSLCAGLAAACAIVLGTRAWLLAAACLLFASAIFDGADGMIARVKKTSSEMGHAIDGAADYAVNLATTAAAVFHLAEAHGSPLLWAALGLGAHVAGASHLMLYDFHSATYLRFATGGRHAGGHLDRGKDLLERLRSRGAPWPSRLLIAAYVWQLGNRQRLVDRVTPAAARHWRAPVDPATSAAYVADHRGRMRGWALLGNSPHMDLMVLAAATDRFDLYFLLRIAGFSALAVALAAASRRS